MTKRLGRGRVSERKSIELLEENMEISIYAIFGFSLFECNEIVGGHWRTVCGILVDSRSTYNFLDLVVTCVSKFRVEETLKLQVKVANGEKLLSIGRCEYIPLKVQRKKFFVSFHMPTLGGCDVALGVQWLKTLVPIFWDFLRMSMEFQCTGTKAVVGLCTGDTSVEDGSTFFRPSSVGKKG